MVWRVRDGVKGGSCQVFYFTSGVYVFNFMICDEIWWRVGGGPDRWVVFK